MKTIYLASPTLSAIITDIQQVAPDYAGESDYSIEGGGIHYIGDIPVNTYDEETGELVNSVSSGKVHANLYLPEENDTVFDCEIPTPENPVNILAI